MRASLPASLVMLTLVSCFSGYSNDAPKGELHVRRGTFASDLVLTGELDAARGATIAVPVLPQWQSSIKWLANDGAEVKKGERVAELDNSSFTADLDTKRQTEQQALQQIQQKEEEWKADIEQKKLDFDTRKSEYEKAKIDASVPRDILSAREYQDRQIKFDRASVEFAKARDILGAQKKENDADRRNLQLQVVKAQREIRIAEEAIDSAVLRAPRDGIVIIKDIPWEGRKIQLGDTVWVGFAIATIPEISSLRVNASLADVDDGRITPGMAAKIILDAYPGMSFPAHVARISAVAQEINPRSLRRLFRVFVDLDRIDAKRMRPGLSARVIVRTRTVQDALMVPRGVIVFQRPDSSPSSRLGMTRARLAGGRTVDVILGPCNAQDCVVTSGLTEGQALETPPVIPSAAEREESGRGSSGSLAALGMTYG